MKHYLWFLLGVSMICAPLMAQPAPSPELNAQYNDIRAEIRKKNYVGAVQKAEQVLQSSGLSAKDRARFLSIAAEASVNQGASQYAVSKSYYEKLIADPAIDNATKVQAISDLADAYLKSLTGQYLDKMDIAPAHAILQRALQLPDLKSEERAVALMNIGKLYDREDKDNEALNTYRKIQQLDVSAATKDKAWQAMVDVYVKEALYGNDQESAKAAREAVSISRKQGFDLASLYDRLGDFDAATALLVGVLDDPNSTDAQRWSAFSKLPCFTRSTGPGSTSGRSNPPAFRAILAEIQQLSAKYLPVLMQADPSRARILLPTFKEAPVAPNLFYYPTNASPAYVAWAGQLLLEVPKLSDKDYALVTAKTIDALAALHENQRVIAQVSSVGNDERLDAAMRFWARLVNVSLASKNADITETIQADKSLSDKAKAQAILDAAQTVLLAGQEETSEALYDAYKTIVPDLPVATINAAFMPNAPDDVGSWLASPLLKDATAGAKFNRPYGDNLKLLQETDATTGGRTSVDSAGGKTGDHDTDFYVACDAQGVHLFFDAHDEHAQEVAEGLLPGSSFETYLAPGENQPYLFLFPVLPNTPMTTGPTNFITMYPNKGWRLPSNDNGTFRNDIRRTKDGFGVSMFLSWDLFYDKLPVNGTKWRFESIRWTRSGGFSFAGSQSVHNPSSWGEIIFSGLTPQNLNAIKRAIIFKAVAKYREAQKITNPVGRWNDAELGDPAFYQSQVASLLARLDAYAARVSKDMTASDVETIFNEAVPGWMELEFQVAALRRQYLENQLFSK
jgi:tetratricopeptide (TPR) repeat protein